MIFNLSPDARLAVVEEKFRIVFPEPGDWKHGRDIAINMQPWERSYMGCKHIPGDGGHSQCGVERAWIVVLCKPLEDQS